MREGEAGLMKMTGCLHPGSVALAAKTALFAAESEAAERGCATDLGRREAFSSAQGEAPVRLTSPKVCRAAFFDGLRLGRSLALPNDFALTISIS
jgi:hypothetical protein